MNLNMCIAILSMAICKKPLSLVRYAGFMVMDLFHQQNRLAIYGGLKPQIET